MVIVLVYNRTHIRIVQHVSEIAYSQTFLPRYVFFLQNRGLPSWPTPSEKCCSVSHPEWKDILAYLVSESIDLGNDYVISVSKREEVTSSIKVRVGSVLLLILTSLDDESFPTPGDKCIWNQNHIATHKDPGLLAILIS
ncbi:hypothetical protein NPIL_235251 [Nephila pilipes]|uniref:Uncharacterized protein n=1 Tax=Nephila pilipes TaxID=299642 RepID=A0A8X6JQM1_NEPPI|nr:hypothetical protein NPIL_235251 [Nephila pilipes]